ncbi:hypothetical protein GMD39_13270, partial [Parasutterella excrementihominis]|nr:hypothetical protein [Parasutterella excrementihominis]
MAATQWATIADVDEVTGKTVTAKERGIAVRSLEPLVGLIESVDRPDISL